MPAFREVAVAAGIDVRHETGAYGEKLLPETMGSGCGFLDYDGDGREDLLLLSGVPFAGRPGPRRGLRLFRNVGPGLRFEEATDAAGLPGDAYAMGMAAADADGDGDVDLLVTCLGPDLFFENLGGRFQERAAASGLADPSFGASAAWLDADGDGLLDLFVANYVAWSIEGEVACTLDGKARAYCTPEPYPAVACRFYRNLGGLRFEDRTDASGVGAHPGKSLGVATLDSDGDGRLDVAVANDTQPNLLFRSRGDGTFEERGLESGIAFSESGSARGAMGIDAGDYDDSGRESLLIANFSDQMLSLYHNEGGGLFVDVAPSGEVGRTSLRTLAFPCAFLDVDADGRLDLFAGNGHVEPGIATVRPEVAYAEPPHMYRNEGGGRFRRVTEEAGPDLARPIVARGAAAGDPDGDGDLDLLVTTSGGPALLFENRLDLPGRGITLALRGRGANRDAIGAVLEVEVGGRTLRRTVSGGGSYLSQSSRRILVGLGGATPAAVRVRWPGGAVESIPGLVPGGRFLVEEGSGRGVPLLPAS